LLPGGSKGILAAIAKMVNAAGTMPSPPLCLIVPSIPTHGLTLMLSYSCPTHLQCRLHHTAVRCDIFSAFFFECVVIEHFA
jgi:hypothetical protein